MKRLLLGLLLIVILLVAVSCGGKTVGGPSAAPQSRGKASVHIAWPVRTAASRVIPLASNSILIQIKDATGSVKANTTIVRPNSTWTSPSLAAGSYTLVATAFPNNDGTGNPDAAGTGSVTIAANATTPSSVTMGSTVTALAISPTTLTPNVGDAPTLAASATDATGAIVLVAASTVSWTSSNPAVATVSATGLTPTVTAVAAGTATISAQFTEIEPSLGQTPVNATANVAVTVSTPGPTLATSGWSRFRGNAQATGLGTGSLSPGAASTHLTDFSTPVAGTQTVIGADGSLFVATIDGNVSKVSPSGGTIWTITAGTAGAGLPTLAATSDGNLLCLTNDGKLVSIDSSTHATTLKYDTGSGSPQLTSLLYGELNVDANGTAYFGSNDGKVYSVASSGKALSISLGGSSTHLSALSLSADGKLLFVSAGGFGSNLYAIHTSTMTQAWESTTASGDPAVSPSGEVVVNDGTEVYGLNPATGGIDWQVAPPSNSNGGILFTNRPAIASDGTVYVTAQLGGAGSSSTPGLLYSIDPTTHLVSHMGSIASILGEPVSSPVIGANGSVYVAVDGTVYAFGSALGNSTANYAFASTQEGDDLVLGPSGALYATGQTPANNVGLYKIQ